MNAGAEVYLNAQQEYISVGGKTNKTPFEQSMHVALACQSPLVPRSRPSVNIEVLCKVGSSTLAASGR